MCNSHDKPIIKKRRAISFVAQLMINIIILSLRTLAMLLLWSNEQIHYINIVFLHTASRSPSVVDRRLLCNHTGLRSINDKGGGLFLFLWCLWPRRLISSACVRSMVLGCLFSLSSLSAALTSSSEQWLFDFFWSLSAQRAAHNYLTTLTTFMPKMLFILWLKSFWDPVFALCSPAPGLSRVLSWLWW